MIVTNSLSLLLLPSPRRRIALVTSTAWLLAWSVPTNAAPPARVTVVAKGACPAAGDVARELQRSLPAATITMDAEAGDESTELVRVIDLGDRYSVRTAGSERTLEEATRDCAERARVAAVFAAVALDPPTFGQRDPDPDPPQHETIPDPAPTSPRSSSTSDGASAPANAGQSDQAALAAYLSVGLLGTWAGAASQPHGLGPELGVGLAGGRFALRVAVGVTTPIRLRFDDDASAELVRLPASVSAYVRASSDSADAGIGLGFAVDGLNISGRGDFTPRNETRIQVGARAAGYGRFNLGERWGFFSELAGTFVPSTYDIELAPVGIVGSTPAVWLGLTLGVTMGLR